MYVLTLAQNHMTSDGQHTFARNVHLDKKFSTLECTKCTMIKTIKLLKIIQYTKLN